MHDKLTAYYPVCSSTKLVQNEMKKKKSRFKIVKQAISMLWADFLK